MRYFIRIINSIPVSLHFHLPASKMGVILSLQYSNRDMAESKRVKNSKKSIPDNGCSNTTSVFLKVTLLPQLIEEKENHAKDSVFR